MTKTDESYCGSVLMAGMQSDCTSNDVNGADLRRYCAAQTVGMVEPTKNKMVFCFVKIILFELYLMLF